MQDNLKKFLWTQHSEIKMRQYGLSKTKLLGILRNPEREEQGIVPGTVAVMKTNKVFTKITPLFKEKTKSVFTKASVWKKKSPGEIWIMYKDVKNKGTSLKQLKIISAWRYPGITKPGEEIPVPEDIRTWIHGQDQL